MNDDLDKVLKNLLADIDRKFEEYDRWYRHELKVVAAKCVCTLIIGTAIACIIVRCLS
jgi:uncharacterized membrane protein YjjP (DUF1212 family)